VPDVFLCHRTADKPLVEQLALARIAHTSGSPPDTLAEV